MKDIFSSAKNMKNYLLTRSVLFKSILVGNEIRYTDLICFFMIQSKFNPFASKSINYKFEVFREKFYTDLWIAEKMDKSHGLVEYYMPKVLIENKLKSLADKKQLTKYTEKFFEEYIKAFKRKLKQEGELNTLSEPIKQSHINRLKDELKELGLFILTPFNPENIPVFVDKLKDKENDEEIGISEIFSWKGFDYETLGGNISNYISNQEAFQTCFLELEKEEKQKQINYIKLLFDDFGKVLKCFRVFEEIIPTIIVEKSINEQFKTNSVFEELGMHVLYQKLIASQCKTKLEAKFAESKNKFQFHSDFFNGNGLFDVKFEIHEGLTFIIQYQNKELRKGILIKTGTALNYSDWFETPWYKGSPEVIEFKPKKDEESSNDKRRYNYFDDTTDKEKTFYYTKFKVDNDISLGTVIRIMKEQMNLKKSYPFLNNKQVSKP